ncbi:MAG: tyrosine-type recombinase/integrase [Rhodoblastus sp.]|uniref:tyrosine-type recombinase/integrase n=2 Tax=Rhodoblastus sp. TaxID=1962975 RepID=UPI003F97A05B
MSIILFDDGIFTVTAKHLLLKNGIYFYYRRIPEDMRGHHGGKRHRRVSLQTRLPQVAAKKAAMLARADDAMWKALRTKTGADGFTTQETKEGGLALLKALGLSPGEALGDDWDADYLDTYFEGRYGDAFISARYDPRGPRPLKSFFNPVEAEVVRLVTTDPNERRVCLSDALEIYLKHHDKGAQKKFAADTRRAVGHVLAEAGDLPLDQYKRKHANDVRDALLATGVKTQTVRRQLTIIAAVVNTGLKEFDFDGVRNPFESVKIPNEGVDAKKRPVFTPDQLRTVAEACREASDDRRYIAAILMDTGARLGEIIGLRIEDVDLAGPIPFIYIRPNLKLGRTLKTPQSERRVPLVAIALWAAQEAVKEAKGKVGWLFPRYAADNAINTNNPSVTLKKWLQGLLKTDQTCHSFRHTMRDRLRNAGVPGDIQDVLGGWGSRSVGMQYGEGHDLTILHENMEKIVLPVANAPITATAS